MIGYPLVICYIAMENGSFIDDLPIKNSDFRESCLFTGGYLICPGLQLFHLFCACNTQKSKRFAI